MISAQDLIEKITSSATCDDCIVVIKEKTQANLRWAGSTLTTNGVIQERNVTVIAFVAINGAMASGGVTRTDVTLAEIPALLSEAIAAAKASGAAEDFAPLATNISIGDWTAPHSPTGPEIFSTFLQHLAICFRVRLQIQLNSLVMQSTLMKRRGLAQKVVYAFAKTVRLVA